MRSEDQTAPKSRPILFSSCMVRAILDGRKTQTRRIVSLSGKKQPIRKDLGGRLIGGYRGPNYWHYGKLLGEWGLSELVGVSEGIATWELQTAVDDSHTVDIKCPYGKVGDLLWVRETFGYFNTGYYDRPEKGAFYRATDNPCSSIFKRWRAAIHMPRDVSRILLRVTDVKAERVQSISEDDAKAEGADTEFRTVVMHSSGCKDYHIPLSHRGGFANLWDEINEKRGYSWESNPFVWAVSFDVVSKEAPSHA